MIYLCLQTSQWVYSHLRLKMVNIFSKGNNNQSKSVHRALYQRTNRWNQQPTQTNLLWRSSNVYVCVLCDCLMTIWGQWRMSPSFLSLFELFITWWHFWARLVSCTCLHVCIVVCLFERAHMLVCVCLSTPSNYQMAMFPNHACIT